jgi:hypothetical protein
MEGIPMHMLHTHLGPIFFNVDAQGGVTFSKDGIELEDSLILMLIHDHIRRGGLAQEAAKDREQTLAPRLSGEPGSAGSASRSTGRNSR